MAFLAPAAAGAGAGAAALGSGAATSALGTQLAGQMVGQAIAANAPGLLAATTGGLGAVAGAGAGGAIAGGAGGAALGGAMGGNPLAGIGNVGPAMADLGNIGQAIPMELPQTGADVSLAGQGLNPSFSGGASIHPPAGGMGVPGPFQGVAEGGTPGIEGWLSQGGTQPSGWDQFLADAEEYAQDQWKNRERQPLQTTDMSQYAQGGPTISPALGYAANMGPQGYGGGGVSNNLASILFGPQGALWR